MLLGFASTVVPELSLAEVLSLASSLGYAAIEVQCWPRSIVEQVTHIDVAELDAQSARRIRELTGRAGVDLSALACVRAGGGAGSGLDVDRLSDQHWRALVNGAELLGVQTIVVDAAAIAGSAGEASGIAELAAYAAQHSVSVSLEFPGPAVRLRASVSSARSPGLPGVPTGTTAGFSYVPLRLVRRGLDEIAPIKRLGTNIRRVRATDDWPAAESLGTAATGDLEQEAAPLPRVRWRECLSALALAGFDGPLTVDLTSPPHATSLEARVDALRAARAYLRPLLRD